MGNMLTAFLKSPMSYNLASGFLLGAGVKNPRDHLYQGVILLSHNLGQSVLGLQINRPLYGVSLGSIVSSLGYDFDIMSKSKCSKHVYFGGIIGGNRLHFVHSLDWIGPNTQVLGNGIGVTSDLSVLHELVVGQGPRFYRACAGIWKWDIHSLREQITESESEHRWEVAPMEHDLVFNQSGYDQWCSVLESSGRYQASSWMS